MPSLNTQLKNRTLWYDGSSSYPVEKVFAVPGRVRYVTSTSPELEMYNKMCSVKDRIQVKNKCDLVDVKWNIPQQYSDLSDTDLIDAIYDMHSAIVNEMIITDSELDRREHRLAEELVLYKKLDLFNTLRAILYVINTLQKTNTVWGVGRGSSVSSYVLYAIGVHDVDSFAYNLPITDFLHE